MIGGLLTANGMYLATAELVVEPSALAQSCVRGEEKDVRVHTEYSKVYHRVCRTKLLLNRA